MARLDSLNPASLTLEHILHVREKRKAGKKIGPQTSVEDKALDKLVGKLSATEIDQFKLLIGVT